MGPRLMSRGYPQLCGAHKRAKPSFNGAAADEPRIRLRRTVGSPACGPSMGPRLMSRGYSHDSGRQAQYLEPSMGPRLMSRGYLGLLLVIHHNCISFNGAAADEPRIQGYRRQARWRGQPSMGPRLMSRGYLVSLCPNSGTISLQWGRG